MNDVIILAAIEAHGKMMKSIYANSPCLFGTNSLSGYCKVSSRLLAMAFNNVQNNFPWGFPRKCLHIRKSKST